MVKRILAQGYVALILLAMYLPIFLLIIFSFINTAVVGVIGPNDTFTLELYRQLFTNARAMTALGNTFLLAFVSSILSTFLGTLGAIGIFYMKQRGKNALEFFTQIPVVNAEIVMALSLAVLIFFFEIPDGFFTLVLGHVVLTVAFVYLSVKPKLQQMDPSMYEAALDLGATPFVALYKVILPEILPGIIAGFVLAFTLSLDDYIITSFLKPPTGFETLSTYVEDQLRQGIPRFIRSLTTIIFLFAVIVLMINYRLTGKGDKKKISAIIHR
jgi:spermidine/putrescine transport system permease protein